VRQSADLENPPARRDFTATPVIKKGDRDLHPDKHEELKKRIVSAAEAALVHHQLCQRDRRPYPNGTTGTDACRVMEERADRLPGAGDPGESQENLAIDGNVPSMGAGEGS